MASGRTRSINASPSFGAYRNQNRAAECLDSVLAILPLVSSQALFVSSRHPAPPLAGLLTGIRSLPRGCPLPLGTARPSAYWNDHMFPQADKVR